MVLASFLGKERGHRLLWKARNPQLSHREVLDLSKKWCVFQKIPYLGTLLFGVRLL